VKVQVIHDLTSLRSCIGRDAIASLSVAQALREESRYADTTPHDGFVFWFETRDGLDMALGNDEQMDGRLGIKILEGEYFFVFVFDLSLALSGDDAAEDTAGSHIFLEVVYTRLVGRRWRRLINEGDRDGYLPQVQTQDPQER
jgi:hypothetical protein